MSILYSAHSRIQTNLQTVLNFHARPCQKNRVSFLVSHIQSVQLQHNSSMARAFFLSWKIKAASALSKRYLNTCICLQILLHLLAIFFSNKFYAFPDSGSWQKDIKWSCDAGAHHHKTHLSQAFQRQYFMLTSCKWHTHK